MSLVRALPMCVVCAACQRSADVAPYDAGSEIDAAHDGTLDARYAMDDGADGMLDARDTVDAAPDAGLSCADDGRPLGSGCRYLASDGTAIIERIESPGPSENACERDPVRVVFRFEPDDPASERCAADSRFGSAREWTFTIGDGKAPPRSCIEGAAIRVGSRLRVQRSDIVAGACTPVTFQFDPALVAACAAQCFR